MKEKQLTKLNKCKTKTYGLSTTTFNGAVLWNNLLNHFKEAKLLLKFETIFCEWRKMYKSFQKVQGLRKRIRKMTIEKMEIDLEETARKLYQ